MDINQDPAAAPRTLQGPAEGERGKEQQVSTQRHSDSVNGSRPEHDAQAHCEYALLAPGERSGDPAAAGPQESGDDTKNTMGK